MPICSLLMQEKDRVGIGTNTPSERLHITGSDAGTTLLLESTGSMLPTDGPILDLFRNSANPAMLMII